MANGEHPLLHHTVHLMDDAATHYVLPLAKLSLPSDVFYDILTPVHLVIFVKNWDLPTQMTVYPHEADGLNVLPSLTVHDFHNELLAVRFNTNIIGQVYLKYTNTFGCGKLYFNTQLGISSPTFTLAFSTRLPLYKFTSPLVQPIFTFILILLAYHQQWYPQSLHIILLHPMNKAVFEVNNVPNATGEQGLTSHCYHGSIPSSLSLGEAVINSCPMLEEGPHSKSVCKAASRKGDVGSNEGNEKTYNLDRDRRWK
ncbi:hypothetical protein B0H14DRAFT_3157796 [Mycena olivaceomarginata]|nr:hypothetical protein B0H14DRAFT_3157796 [Mycena olivaceomarginata]